ncbi:MAG: DUF262 domain-containing protein [Desulfovibrio sp.]|nr:DUF262 domain-containing protein [Desulfovibrio sp.]
MTAPQVNDNPSKIVLINEDEAPLDGDDVSNDDVDIASPFDITQIRIASKPSQLDTLIKRLKNSEIDLAPDFQRASGIWTDKAQSRLIESLILRIPIPSFYFDATNDSKWVVVDGLQRLTAIDRFVIKEELALTELEFLTDYNGKKFSSLPRNFIRNIEEADITMYLIQEGTPTEVKFNLFKRINTGGLPLSAQEIRHALNQGGITQLLKELSESKEFKKATAYGISPNRMGDKECITRFFAFMLNNPESYDQYDFDFFLHSSMHKINAMPKAKQKEFSNAFLTAMNRATKIFGNDAFRKRYKEGDGRYPISKSLFETWAVNLANISEDEANTLIKRKISLKKKFINLMNTDNKFEMAISQGTGAKSRVRYRFAAIKKIIAEVIDA